MHSDTSRILSFSKPIAQIRHSIEDWVVHRIRHGGNTTVQRPMAVVHRSRGGMALFDIEQDYQAYLSMLGQVKRKLKVRIYAYCVLPDAVHLLIDAGVRTACVSQMMNELATWQARALDGEDASTQSYWQNDIGMTPVLSGSDVLRQCHILEYAPVDACLADTPDAYPWSSRRAHASMRMQARHRHLIDYCEYYLALGDNWRARATVYQSVSQPERLWQRRLMQRARRAGVVPFH